MPILHEAETAGIQRLEAGQKIELEDGYAFAVVWIDETGVNLSRVSVEALSKCLDDGKNHFQLPCSEAECLITVRKGFQVSAVADYDDVIDVRESDNVMDGYGSAVKNQDVLDRF